MQLIDIYISIVVLVREASGGMADASPVLEQGGTTSGLARGLLAATTIPMTAELKQDAAGLTAPDVVESACQDDVTLATIVGHTLLPDSLNARLNGDGPRYDASALAQRLAGMIGEARSIARKHELARMDFEKGLFAVLAWADETLLSGDWPGAAEWQRHLLQLRYFNSITAGVEFFTILDTLGPEQKDLREVFALCLCLGFKGRFASERTLRGLEEKRRTVIEQVIATVGLPEESRHLLFPDAYGTRRSFGQRASRLVNSLRRLHRAPGRPSNETLTLIGAPLLLLIVLYVTYSAIAGSMIGALVAQIK